MDSLLIILIILLILLNIAIIWFLFKNKSDKTNPEQNFKDEFNSLKDS